MIQTADLKAKVMRLWGNPADTELSPQSLRDAIESVWNIVMMEMSIVSPSYLAKFSETFVLSDGYNAPLNILDMAVPVAVECRKNGGYLEGDWSQVDTAGFENWDYYKANNQPVALLTGSGETLSLRTNFDASGSEFRLRYIADGQINDSNAPLSAAIELPGFFSPMFEKGAAAQAGDLIQTTREAFAATITGKTQGFNAEFLMFLARFKEWLRSSRTGKGIAYRTPSNASRRGPSYRRRFGFPR